MEIDLTVDELKKYGIRNKALKQRDYEPKPIVKFQHIEYMILHQPTIKPGRQTADVLNVTEFDADSHFVIARDDAGNGFVVYEDEGWAVLTIYTNNKGEKSLHEYTNPSSAVLTYNVQPPTRDKDIRQFFRNSFHQIKELIQV